jgi:hypothetical protein
VGPGALRIAYAHPNSHSYSNCHLHGYSDRNCDVNSYSYGNRYIYAYGDSNLYADGYCHVHAYTYSYGNIHANPDANANSDVRAIHNKSDRGQHCARYGR